MSLSFLVRSFCDATRLSPTDLSDTPTSAGEYDGYTIGKSVQSTAKRKVHLLFSFLIEAGSY